MKRRAKGLIVYLIVTVLIAQYNPISLTYADTQSEAESKKKALEDEQSSKQADLDAYENQKSQQQEYLQSMDAQLTEVSSRIYELEVQSEKKEKEIKATQIKLDEAEVSIVEQYEDMKLRIKFMYENGNTEYLNLLLSSDSIADFLNRAEYVTKITEYDKNMLTIMRETKETIEVSKAKLVEDNEKLTALKSEQEDKQTTLIALIDQKKSDLEATNSKISGTAADLSSLDAEIEAQESEIQRIEAERKKREAEAEKARQASILAAQKTSAFASASTDPAADNNTGSEPSASAGSGSYQWPLPSQYRTRTSSFGYRTDPFGSGQQVYHCGDDYPAPAGTPIYAVADGTVESSQYSSGTGNCVVIYHGNGLSSVYMHASVLIANAGQTVKKGEVIALVGTTGPSTGNHLHISFRLNGQWVDPKIYIGG